LGEAGLTGAYLAPGSSFAEFLAREAPHLLPGSRIVGTEGASLTSDDGAAPSATTAVALTYPGGIIMAGDRRATVGTTIASRDIEKVYPADGTSAIAVAGTAGLAIELVRMFQLELEHYEKVEGTGLSIAGKANRLATLVRSHLALALRGLAVVPLYGGYDTERKQGRIFSYDVTGGRYEEREYHAVGSGAVFARGSLKKLWNPQLTSDQAARTAVTALIDAADDDAATAGPDVGRAIWPVVARVDESGYRRLPDEELAAIVHEIYEGATR